METPAPALPSTTTGSVEVSGVVTDSGAVTDGGGSAAKRKDPLKAGLDTLQRALPHVGSPEEEKVGSIQVGGRGISIAAPSIF